MKYPGSHKKKNVAASYFWRLYLLLTMIICFHKEEGPNLFSTSKAGGCKTDMTIEIGSQWPLNYYDLPYH